MNGVFELESEFLSFVQHVLLCFLCRYTNVVRLELLKFYELLVSQSRHLLLVHEPFLRPMLKLFTSCRGEVFEKDKEKKLVALLYQLCVLLMQNVDLVDLFIIKEQEKSR